MTLLYIGIRLFGDETWLGYLDTFEARLRIGSCDFYCKIFN